jgi:hypothetical protein
METGSWLRVRDAARLMGRSHERVYKLIEAGVLEKRAALVRGTGSRPITLVSLASLERWIDENVEGQARLPLKSRARSQARATEILASDRGEAQQEIVRRYDTGESIAEIARDMGMFITTVSDALKDAGVDVKSARDYHQSKREEFAASLTPEQQEFIRKRYAQGAGPLKIAVELGWGQRQDKVTRALLGMGVTMRRRPRRKV